MSVGLFSLAKKWVLCMYISEEWPYCYVFPSTAANKQLEMVSLHMALSLFLPAKPLLLLLQNDATNCPLAVSGASLMSPLRAPGAALPLRSQINLLPLY